MNAIVLALLIGSGCNTGYCYRPAIVKQQVVYATPVYFLVGSEIRTEAVAEKAAQRAADAIIQQYEAKIASLTARLSGKLCVEFGGDTSTGAGTAVTPSPNPAAADASAAQAVVNAQCVRCHQGPGSKGGDKDFRNLAALDELTKHRIEFRARTGTMPPKNEGAPVSDADAETLQKWISGH